MPKITDFTVESLAPKGDLIDAEVAKLLPVRHAQRVSCKINDASNAVSNAIRRTISSELPVYAMVGDTVETDDVFVIAEMVLRRIQLIPIDQSGRSESVDKFTLDVRNDGTEIRDVKSGEIKYAEGVSGKRSQHLPFNGTYTVCTLRPGCRLRIPLIVPRVDRGYNFAGHCVASNVVSLVSGGPPQEVTTSNPREWILRFITNGTMEPRAIIQASLADLAERVRSALTHGRRDYDGTHHLLTIPGETDTIGNLLMRTVIDLKPDIPAVVYRTSTYSREVTLVTDLGNGASADDAAALYTKIGEYLLGVFEQLARSL